MHAAQDIGSSVQVRADEPLLFGSAQAPTDSPAADFNISDRFPGFYGDSLAYKLLLASPLLHRHAPVRARRAATPAPGAFTFCPRQAIWICAKFRPQRFPKFISGFCSRLQPNIIWPFFLAVEELIINLAVGVIKSLIPPARFSVSRSGSANILHLKAQDIAEPAPTLRQLKWHNFCFSRRL